MLYLAVHSDPERAGEACCCSQTFMHGLSLLPTLCPLVPLSSLSTFLTCRVHPRAHRPGQRRPDPPGHTLHLLLWAHTCCARGGDLLHKLPSCSPRKQLRCLPHRAVPLFAAPGSRAAAGHRLSRSRQLVAGRWKCPLACLNSLHRRPLRSSCYCAPCRPQMAPCTWQQQRAAHCSQLLLGCWKCPALMRWRPASRMTGSWCSCRRPRR